MPSLSGQCVHVVEGMSADVEVAQNDSGQLDDTQAQLVSGAVLVSLD